MYRGVLFVAVTGVASAAAFSVPPMSLPGMPGSGAALRATASRATARSASLSLEMARVPFIAGNWKMNPTSVEEVSLVSSLSSACTVWQDILPFLRSQASFVGLFWIGDRHDTPPFCNSLSTFVSVSACACVSLCLYVAGYVAGAGDCGR